MVGTLLLPLDTVRRLMIMDQAQYLNAWHCTLLLVEQKGIGALWRGTAANLIRSWSTGLTLAGFSFLEELIIENMK